MGMYDDYVPDPLLTCPVDGFVFDDGDVWQGKDGPCVLAVFRQGQRIVGDYGTHGYTGPYPNYGEDLPESGTFELYDSHEAPDEYHWVEARGVIVDGVWTETYVDRVEQGIDGPVIWQRETVSA